MIRIWLKPPKRIHNDQRSLCLFGFSFGWAPAGALASWPAWPERQLCRSMGQENAVKSDEDLYRELKWLLPTTSLDIYVTAGTWQRDLLLVDLELIKAHRREAGAPEAAPVDLKKVLPELQGRHIRSHVRPDAQAPAPLAPPVPPAPPAPPPAPHVPNGKEAPPRTQYVSTSTASFRNLPPRNPPNPPSKGVVKEALTKTSVSRLAGSFALGKRSGSAPSNRVPNASVSKAGPNYGAPSAANRRLAYGEQPASVRRTDHPVVTEEVKSVHGSYKNGQEALSRPPYVSTSTASVQKLPPRNPPPSKGVVKDPITKGSVRRMAEVPLGARTRDAGAPKRGTAASATPRSASAPPKDAPFTSTSAPPSSRSPAPPKDAPLTSRSAPPSSRSGPAPPKDAPLTSRSAPPSSRSGPAPPKGAPPTSRSGPAPPQGAPPTSRSGPAPPKGAPPTSRSGPAPPKGAPPTSRSGPAPPKGAPPTSRRLPGTSGPQAKSAPAQRASMASRDKWAASKECTCSKSIDGEAGQSQDHPPEAGWKRRNAASSQAILGICSVSALSALSALSTSAVGQLWQSDSETALSSGGWAPSQRGLALEESPVVGRCPFRG
eukprot:s24_g54.t1